MRLHYAKTLAHWIQRFEANRDKVEAMYDEKFGRMWEFYLISAEMMFRTGSQLVFHMQLSRYPRSSMKPRKAALRVPVWVTASASN